MIQTIFFSHSQICLDTTYWTIVNHFTIWGSVVAYFAIDYVYNYYLGGPYVGALTIAMKGPNFWLTSLVCVVILLLPTLTLRFHAFVANPSLADRIRMKRKLHRKSETDSAITRRAYSAKRTRRSIHSGYAFSHHVRIHYSSTFLIVEFLDFSLKKKLCFDGFLVLWL